MEVWIVNPNKGGVASVPGSPRAGGMTYVLVSPNKGGVALVLVSQEATLNNTE